MRRITECLILLQEEFIRYGVRYLRPLTRAQVAQYLGIHESTVSRATADKYVATPHGTFPLKFFFTTAIAAVSGEEAHSAEVIRQQIRKLVEREGPDVLSDDQIVSELRRLGAVIARRTVAKYRESLGIPSSVERRRAKALAG